MLSWLCVSPTQIARLCLSVCIHARRRSHPPSPYFSRVHLLVSPLSLRRPLVLLSSVTRCRWFAQVTGGRGQRRCKQRCRSLASARATTVSYGVVRRFLLEPTAQAARPGLPLAFDDCIVTCLPLLRRSVSSFWQGKTARELPEQWLAHIRASSLDYAACASLCRAAPASTYLYTSSVCTNFH